MMSFFGNLVINIYSLTILVIIYLQSKKQNEDSSIQNKIYILMLESTFVLILMDTLSLIESEAGTLYSLMNHFGYAMLFLFNLLIPSLWLIYVYIQVHPEGGRTGRLITVLAVLNGINIISGLVSQSKGWFYYYDSQDIYHRGPLFLLPAVITVLLITSTYYLIIKYHSKIDRKQGFILAFFAVLPLCGIILQILFFGISLMLNCIVLSLLLVFLNIQNNNLYTDYLTGVNNRKRFDLYLNEKIKNCTKNRTFSAIMLDVNDFKKINDSLGHDTGDGVLKMSMQLLYSCLRRKDFIARTGGDEFCIILDISDQHELEEIVQRINKRFDLYNKTSDQPYLLSFSMGYAVYDYHSFMKMEEFVKQLDILMYEDKQRRKSDIVNANIT